MGMSGVIYKSISITNFKTKQKGTTASENTEVHTNEPNSSSIDRERDEVEVTRMKGSNSR